ncbi:MAG TPA: glycosyltransferase family 87 protein [Pseudolabrys sp.]|nr:glycosyltransferase family 87 protein [Pseudolabrys sp.]
MSAQSLADAAPRPLSPTRIIALAGLTLALGYAVVLIGAFAGGEFLLDPQGRGIANDFVNVWAAGALTLDGHPAAAYDWTLHKAAEVNAVGHDFANNYGWHYPPTFLFAAASLALIPYAAAGALWLVVTLIPYLAAMRAIIGTRAGILFALGWPAALWNVTAGQNGFLTAALIGGTLAAMERHPTLAGVCLGLLTYKPHFGLLFPLVLAVSGRWRVIGVASAVALALAAASWLAFSGASWQAFISGMGTTGEIVLGEGRADLYRLQSLFGFVRAHGGSETLAWSAQISLAMLLAIALCWLWRSRADFEIKAAALSAAALAATPYLYIYDLVVLAVPAAFLIRLGLKRGFLASEVFGLTAAAVLLLSYPYAKTHVGLAAIVLVLTLIAKRARPALA